MQGMKMDIQEILRRLEHGQAELIDIRRDIHANPEVGLEEFRTARIVADKLREWGVDVTENIARTGVVGTVRGNLPGQRAIGLRADMDALHISEKTDLPYASTVPGKMHACGHDGHTAMLLGAARYLAANPDFAGTVHFIFQPAEEGIGGAQMMIEDGLFTHFPVDAVYGMHNQPGRPAGQFGIRPGPIMAASDAWSLTFRGTGGHGGNAIHLSTDSTLCLGAFITALQTIVSRNVSPIETGVVSVGFVSGGSDGSPNIIPSECRIGGTARSYSPAVRDTIERRLREIAESVAMTFGCSVPEFEYERGTPPVVNAREQTEMAIAAASDLVGSANVEPDMAPLTAAEDFADMLEQRPGALIWIGNGLSEDGSFHDLHTPRYNFNDDILTLGSAYWISVVRRELAHLP